MKRKNMTKQEVREAIKRLEEFAERVEEKLYPKVKLTTYGEAGVGKTTLVDIPRKSDGSTDYPTLDRDLKKDLADNHGYSRDSTLVDAEPVPDYPQTQFEKWQQTYWWKSKAGPDDGWIPVSALGAEHLENIVLMIEETPGRFTARIRRELTEIFLNRQPDSSSHLLQLLAASLDLMWIDNHPDKFMLSTPLYKALKEMHNGNG